MQCAADVTSGVIASPAVDSRSPTRAARVYYGSVHCSVRCSSPRSPRSPSRLPSVTTSLTLSLTLCVLSYTPFLRALMFFAITGYTVALCIFLLQVINSPLQAARAPLTSGIFDVIFRQSSGALRPCPVTSEHGAYMAYIRRTAAQRRMCVSLAIADCSRCDVVTWATRLAAAAAQGLLLQSQQQRR